MLCNTAQVTSQKLSKVIITESITVLDGIEADLRIRVNCERQESGPGPTSDSLIFIGSNMTFLVLVDSIRQPDNPDLPSTDRELCHDLRQLHLLLTR